ncbi:bifunctional diguanylate cyclase/phosphodiesterase [Agrobacterium vitis]|uniref:bifunctional diguanylate cyclase/phosphodiesterase n=1 Tax=Agrobacterium vitis TaxID=373 RepID=UPI00114CBB0F|nr:EAL domain-containing protein [Agrobacterium vitis]MCE6074105.1 EAL domain-containing protein [Agrobacterium vitis]MCM2468935.1 EAL domain-containing protein [Agrobacterium vitis]MUO71308.1 EAL domain-containing protein [Agrobacterium vitis]MUO85065.1 EAL domain-containing protein [Agrobacterium vitis]MVA34278.1 EAL domain-containing protein [Agrobacterium vitis]
MMIISAWAGNIAGSVRKLASFYWPAFIVCTAVFVTIFAIENQNRKAYLEDRKAAITDKLSPVRARLEGNIKADIKMLQGLLAVLETEPDMSQARFSAIGRRFFSRPVRLRSISLSFDMQTRLTYPFILNQIGYDFAANPQEQKAALQAMRSNIYVITEPMNLPNTGNSLVIFYPIASSSLNEPVGASADLPDDQTSLQDKPFSHGLLRGTVDVERLFRESGLYDLDMNVALYADSDTQNAENTAFFGDPALIGASAVRMEVSIGAQSWVLAAAPKGGWQQPANEVWFRQLVMFILALTIITPFLWVAHLLMERQANIAELNEQERELRTLSQRLQIALDASQIGVWEMDIGSLALTWDNRMRQLYDCDPSRPIETREDWSNCLHPEDRESASHALATAIRTGANYSTEFRILDRSGQIRHIRSFGSIYRDADFRKKIVGVNWNITADVKLHEALHDAKTALEAQNHELENARRIMEHTSLHDPLTGLANRRFLDRHLADIEAISGSGKSVALLHIDLDRFKEINDTLGHAAGDAMLRHAASQINAHISPGDFAARIGGDEFVVVKHDKSNQTTARILGEALIDAINQPIHWEGQECRVSASIGIAQSYNSHPHLEQALINADIALYEAKRRGKNRLEFFSDTLKEATLSTKRTADAILRSLADHDFIPYFQPQFNAHTMQITGVEALARWQHPQLGLLPPIAFLSVAESLNVVAAIDNSILEQSLAEARRWQEHGLDTPHVSVNISAQRLFDDGLVAHLRDTPLPAGGLAFELLESISFDDKAEAAATAISQIKILGIDIEIDDFGTGYSSILSLLKLSPRRLKIDRQLTQPIIESKQQRRLIGSIVEIGRSLGIEIIAEGVETMQHAEILRDLGCHTLQGYGLARPMNGDDLFALLKRRSLDRKQDAIAL